MSDLSANIQRMIELKDEKIKILELQLREATELLRQADSLYRNYGLIANPPGGIRQYPEYKGDICCGKWMNGVSAFLDKMAEDGVRKMGFTLDRTRESDKK